MDVTVCGWHGSGGACICAFPGTGMCRGGGVGCVGAGCWPAGGAGTGALGGGAFACGSAVCGGCGNCSAGGRAVAGRPAGASLPGSCGGGVCRLAAFCTGGPVDGSYCCWLGFCPAS